MLFLYGVLGAVGTLFHYVTMAMLIEWAGVDVVYATSVGFVVGALVNHELNRRYLFSEASRAHSVTLLRFMLIAALGFFLNAGIVLLSTRVAGFHYAPAQILATLMVFFVTFLVNRYWTFR